MDETTDVSNNEQASMCIRYVYNFEIKERFIEVYDVDSTTGEKLEEVALSFLDKNGLELENMFGTGFDGAANMSGIYNGLQARIHQRNEKALYIH